MDIVVRHPKSPNIKNKRPAKALQLADLELLRPEYCTKVDIGTARAWEAGGSIPEVRRLNPYLLCLRETGPVSR
jgi:hypothetical protein